MSHWEFCLLSDFGNHKVLEINPGPYAHQTSTVPLSYTPNLSNFGNLRVQQVTSGAPLMISILQGLLCYLHKVLLIFCK
jgi:hypothetical protein